MEACTKQAVATSKNSGVDEFQSHYVNINSSSTWGCVRTTRAQLTSKLHALHG